MESTAAELRAAGEAHVAATDEEASAAIVCGGIMAITFSLLQSLLLEALPLTAAWRVAGHSAWGAVAVAGGALLWHGIRRYRRHDLGEELLRRADAAAAESAASDDRRAGAAPSE